MTRLERLIANFSIENLQGFFRDVNPDFRPNDRDYGFLFQGDTRIHEQIRQKYERIRVVGFAQMENADELVVIAARSRESLTSRTGKKLQYQVAKDILKYENRDAAIFVFYDDAGAFRFSLVRAQYKGRNRDFTTFKRYTYFVSPNLTNATFKKQVGSADFTDLDNLQKAFSVEPVTREFYTRVADAFYRLVGSTTNKKRYQPALKLPSTDIDTDPEKYRQFAVRLIGRTLFVWFLKNKSSDSGKPLIPNAWLSSEYVEKTRDYYHGLLEKLFFEMLNTPVDKRDDATLPDGHRYVPFLNGGLFEPDPDDFYKPGPGGFSLSHNTLKVPDQWFVDFFQTLEQFNFTIDENSLNDQEISIDPEMLGTIFENLLAEIDPATQQTARKATGSFYTPRPVVDYMVQQALMAHLQAKTGLDEQKLHALFTDDDVEFTGEQKNALLIAFDTLKLLDPACGSGAFPMGALHKITTALQKLDPDAQWWKDRQLAKIENPAYRESLRKKLDDSEVDYIRKLGVIQHSIYGVDIQPIATEIARLRCFLSLVVDERIDDHAKNRGIYALPNLEFKFVTANTLIHLGKDWNPDLDFTGTDADIRELQRYRDEYMYATGDDKSGLKKRILELRDLIAEKEAKATHSAGWITKVGNWAPFGNRPSPWFDPKMMFGRDAFDIVIGNPPYIQLQKASGSGEKFADFYKNENYYTFDRTGDIYALFYERGIELLEHSGVLCYITSNKWMRAAYGKKLRHFLCVHDPMKLLDLGPGVFNTATVDTNILLIRKTGKKLQDVNIKKENCGVRAITLHAGKDAKTDLAALDDNEFITLDDLGEQSWIIISKQEQQIKDKIQRMGTPLEQWDVKINYGIKTGFNPAFIIDGKTRDELIKKDPKSAEIIKPILRGRDIERYRANFADKWLIATFPALHLDIDDYPAIKAFLQGFWPKLVQEARPISQQERQSLMEHARKYGIKLKMSDLKKSRKKTGNQWFETQDQIGYYEEFEKEKIIYREISDAMNATLVKEGLYTNNKLYLITGERLKLILAVLNSFLFARMMLASTNVTGGKGQDFLSEVKIPKIPEAQQKPFEDLVDQIIAKKALGQDTSAQERRIDIMVYKLYGLDYAEVKIIDPDFALTRQEYENFK